MPLLQQNGLYFAPAEIKLLRRDLIRPDLVRPFRETMRQAIESAMILCGGNMALAARSLGLKRATLHSMWRKYVQDEK